MATIGNISVVFGADTSSLLSGVSAAASSLNALSDSIRGVQDRLRGLADVASVSVRVEATGLDGIEESVSSLESASSAARSQVEDLGTAVEETGRATEGSSSAISTFAREASAALSATSAEAVGGTQGFIAMRESISGLRDVAAETLNAVSTTSAQASAAVTGLSAAFGSLSADTAITAAGRVYDAYGSLVELFRTTIPNAYVAAGAATTTLVSTMGGLSTISAAFGGSAAAASIAVGSLASTLASAAAAVLTYSGVIAVADAASSSLSEESQRYVERASRVVGAMLSGVAAAATAAQTFRIVATSMFAATSASDALARVLQGLGSSAAAMVGPAGRLLAVVNAVVVGFRVMDAAADGSASRMLSLAARTATTTAAVGAIGGVMTSAAAGTSLAAGALSGAGAAVAGLATALPVFAAGAAVASVATSSLDDAAVKLRQHIGQAAQQLGDLSDRFGQSVQEMERLRIAAANANVSITLVTRAQQNFYSSLSKVKIGQLGTEQAREAKAAFDRLRISADDLSNASPEEVFERVAKKLSEVEDPAKKTQLAMDLFGRTGPAILPMLKTMGGLSAEIDRLGGLISDIDYARFTNMNASFDRLRTASGALSDDLQIPFTRMQEAVNNAGAELRGGFAQVVGAIGEMIADATTPVAVLIEMFARVGGTILRVGAAVLKLVGVFQIFATVAGAAEIIGDLFNDMWSYVEVAVKAFEDFASLVEEYLGDSIESIMSVGEALTDFLNMFTNFAGLGDVFGPVTASILGVAAAITWAMASSQAWSMVMATTAGTAIASAVATAAAWVAGAAAIVVGVTAAAVAIGVYYVGLVLAATATTIASCIAMHVAWLFGLGPIGLIIAAVELVIASVVGLYAMGSSIVDFFSNWGEGQKKIDGATASTEELAAAVAANENRSEPGFLKDLEEVSRAAGATEEEIAALKAQAAEALRGLGFDLEIGPGAEEAAASIQSARDSMAGLSVEAAKLGQVGADAVMSANEEFSDLQRQLATGKISLEKFNEEAAIIESSLSEGLEAAKKSSPEETLKKNLDLFKQLDDAAKSAAKSVRDIGAGVQIGDKFFPRSEEIKSRAKEYADEYSSALGDIKQKLASGGFQEELDARRKQNESDLASGKIDEKTFQKTKIELDNTSAQEQASIAAEEAQRELSRKNAKLKVDLDFADSIRKSLETAFLTPVQKFQKELKKIRDNPELTSAEKDQAESNLRREAREGLIGKTAQTQLQERRRDLEQGVESGLISKEQADFQGKKALDDFAQALGVAKTPFEEFSTSIDGIAEKFGFVGQPLDEVRKKLEGTPEQLALFDRAVKESRDKLLASLGIEKSPEQVFQEQMKKIEEAANSSDPNKRITAEQRQQAEAAARRQRDKALGVGDGLGEQFAERQANINEAFGGGKDNARLAIANNALAADKRAAAGLDADPAQQLKAGAAKINDVFGVTGKSLAEIQASLSPEDFALYQEAQKKNTENIKASLGVEKTGAAQFAEARQKLTKAVADGVISQEEANKALKNQKDALLQSLGISKSPAQEFESAVAKIKENAAELTPEELQKGLKEAKDKLLQSLGVDKSPAAAAEESLNKLREAFNKGQISAEEFAKGSQRAKDSLLQSLGIPLDPVAQLGERLTSLQEAFDKGLISQEEFTRGQDEARRAMLPGGEAESPVKKFERDLDAVGRAVEAGLISEEEGAQRKQVLQAQLQEDLKPALDRVAPDRRAIESSDVRSKEGVDTFFRILRGNDNPSLKAQLETARNTRQLAEAAANADAAPVIAQLSAK